MIEEMFTLQNAIIAILGAIATIASIFAGKQRQKNKEILDVMDRSELPNKDFGIIAKMLNFKAAAKAIEKLIK